MSNELITTRPGYLADPSVQYDNSDLQRYSKPPRIKIVEALTGVPFKPAFKDGDIVTFPSLQKIGDTTTPFELVIVHFFPTWICLNPIQMRGQLKSIREFTMDPESDLAKKCRSFAKIKCPENEQYYLNYSQTLNFMIVVEQEGIEDIPFHLFFARGRYVDGQALITLLEKRKAPRYACRFRAGSFFYTGPKGKWYRLAMDDAPEPWVTEDNFKKYKRYHEEIKTLVDTRMMEFDLTDAAESGESIASEF